MSEDLTKKLPMSDNENLLLTAVQNLDTRMQNFDTRMQNLDTRVQNLDTHVRTSFDQLVSWVSSIDSRLKHLDEKVEQRLHDTRPIWHKVVADIAQLQTGQDAMREEMREINNTARQVNRDQIVINDVIRRIQLDFHNIDERLHRLAVPRNQQNSST